MLQRSRHQRHPWHSQALCQPWCTGAPCLGPGQKIRNLKSCKPKLLAGGAIQVWHWIRPRPGLLREGGPGCLWRRSGCHRLRFFVIGLTLELETRTLWNILWKMENLEEKSWRSQKSKGFVFLSDWLADGAQDSRQHWGGHRGNAGGGELDIC